MHRTTLLFRPFMSLLAPLSLSVVLAGMCPAEEVSLGRRLAQLRESWTGGDESDAVDARPATRRGETGRDLFDALGGHSPASRTPRVASREMPDAAAITTPLQSRAGSILGKAAATGGLDIGAALGGVAPKADPIEPADPKAAVAAESAPQVTEVAVPIEVAAKPSPGSDSVKTRFRSTGDLALDLIGSNASSRDTSGLADSQPTGDDNATDSFPSDAATNSAITPIEEPQRNGSGFASAADAAAAAQPNINERRGNSSSIPPSTARPRGVDVVTDRPDTAPDEWTRTDSAADFTDPLVDASSSVVAERAFSHQTPRSAASGDSVLMNEQLPLITSRVLGPKTILIGREAKYQVIVENRGSAAANQLSTDIVAPEWADVLHVVASSGAVQRPTSETGGTLLRWDLSSLEAGRKQSLDLVVVPKTSQPLSLGVSWRHAPVASTTMVQVQEPKLAMALSGPDEVFFGRAQSYRLSLSNPGTGPAENVVVQLMPPGGGQVVSSYRIDKLAPGESKTVDVEITAREAGELSIQAVATADGNLRTETAQQIFCRRAELNVDWRGPERKYAGTEATYYFRVRNPGTASADQVVLDVALPAGFEFRGASDGHHFDRSTGSVVWKVGTLRPGDDCYLELRGIVNQAGKNAMRLSAANDNGDVHDTKTATTNVIALADLKLDVSDPKGPVPVGKEVNYEITVTNRGRSTAEAVNIVGLFSEGIEPISAEGAEATIADGRVGFRTLNALPAGQQAKLKIRARALSSGTHLFRAEVICRDLEIKLAAEETTRFFQDESTASASGAPLEAASRASRFE